MNTNPLALPPIDPEPICVQRKVPSQNLRSKTGNSATRGFKLLIDTSHCIIVDAARFKTPRRSDAHLARGWRRPSHPAAFVTRFGYSADRDRVGGISHIQLFPASQIGDRKVR